MMSMDAPEGGLYVKMDERPFRMLILEGNENRYLASGWELASEEAFAAAIAELDQKGIAWEAGDDRLCNQRAVQQLAIVRDPAGNRHELYWGHRSEFLPIRVTAGRAALCDRRDGVGSCRAAGAQL